MPMIAVDAMGGDHGIPVMLAGAALARHRHDNFRFLLIGDQPLIEKALDKHPNLRAAADILHAEKVISGEERPSQAVRQSKGTSMGMAIQAVKNGDAQAALSAGNTGALMAIAKLALRTIPGIDRPALAALLPTLKDNDVIMLDLGANTECNARNLVQFAIMGAAYSRILYDYDAPSVRILNIGTEDMKGTDDLREAAQILGESRALAMNFEGFTEADKICRGEIDVIVSDGFTGNIALKSVEGAARFVTDLLKRSFASSLRSKFGFLISRPATELLRHHLDPNNHNGAVFLGLNGVVVKSHGSADAKGVANAAAVAARLVANDLTQRITEDLDRTDTAAKAPSAVANDAGGDGAEPPPAGSSAGVIG